MSKIHNAGDMQDSGGIGFRVSGLGSGVWGLGFRVLGFQGFRVVGFWVLGLASTVFLFWMWVFYRCVFLVVSALLAAGTSFLAAGCARAGAFFVAVDTGCLFKRGCLLRERGSQKRSAPPPAAHLRLST